MENRLGKIFFRGRKEGFWAILCFSRWLLLSWPDLFLSTFSLIVRLERSTLDNFSAMMSFNIFFGSSIFFLMKAWSSLPLAISGNPVNLIASSLLSSSWAALLLMSLQVPLKGLLSCHTSRCSPSSYLHLSYVVGWLVLSQVRSLQKELKSHSSYFRKDVQPDVKGQISPVHEVFLAKCALEQPLLAVKVQILTMFEVWTLLLCRKCRRLISWWW